MIAIINYGSGNVSAIENIYKQLRYPYMVTSDLALLKTADRYVLPGVGAFDVTMRQLCNSGLTELLCEEVLVNGKPFLGICVGMQVLAQSSEEGELAGLGWIRGAVRRIRPEAEEGRLRLPHMGWNSIVPEKLHPLFLDVDMDRGFYFLHNYFFSADNSDDIICTADYGGLLPCGVAAGNVFGLQFHPEKSHRNGVLVFRNFAEI